MKLIYHTLSYFFLISNIFSQTFIQNPELKSFQVDTIDKHSFLLAFNQSFYLNTNLPNLENQNGYYFPKGYGSISSLLFQYNSKHLTFSVEPVKIDKKEYSILLPKKEKLFSVLNDVPMNPNYKYNQLRNTGIYLQYNDISIGYGNWNQWWGPGIHNSLVLSNNAEGFYYYYISSGGYQQFVDGASYKIKYIVSDEMKNMAGDDYFLSALFFNVKYNILEFGISRSILSGGYNEIHWSLNDALTVLFNNKNSRYWDTIDEYYVLMKFPDSGFEFFLDIGFPNRTYAGKDPKVYSDHAIGSNLGFRKQGAFNSDKILFGFDYTRLVQGIYYNILPTPNWGDNIKYNYSSYKDRRWAAHSGADSDDFLIFIGYKDEQKSFIYGLNYERHGVTFHFPPEVKLESRINISYKSGNTIFQLLYENEYFEHYGFVDGNSNVWDEIFEYGSIQRTHTLLLSLKHTLSF